MAIFEGVCERGFGSTFALQFYPEYLDRHCAVPWVPDFFHAPIDQGLARLKMLAPPPGLLGPCLLSPFLLRLASSLRGERSRIALDLAGCPLLPASGAATFGPPRPSAPGASRRRSTSVAASGSSFPAARSRAALRRRGSSGAEP